MADRGIMNLPPTAPFPVAGSRCRDDGESKDINRPAAGAGHGRSRPPLLVAGPKGQEMPGRSTMPDPVEIVAPGEQIPKEFMVRW